MSESDDLKTIAELLGNLIDRIEKVEKEQSATTDKLDALLKLSQKTSTNENTRWEAMRNVVSSLQKTLTRYTAQSSALEATVKSQGSDDHEARVRHAEVDQWTKDISAKMTDMRSAVEKIKIATEKKHGFFS